MRRFLGIIFGLGTQAVFLATLPLIYKFLRNDFAAASEGSLWVDAAASLQFAIPHSLLLYPRTKTWITKWLRPELYGCLFCLATCASIWLQVAIWRGSHTIVWQWPEPLKPAVRFAFLLMWVALVYSLNLTGLGYQTGLSQWWGWVRGRRLERRHFQPAGAYRWLRHPVYLSFLGLVWLTPVVTADRAIFIALTTAYVMFGSYLKDERLANALGEPYRQYLTKVPGYPLMLWGPLGRRRATLPADTGPIQSTTDQTARRRAA